MTMTTSRFFFFLPKSLPNFCVALESHSPANYLQSHWHHLLLFIKLGLHTISFLNSFLFNNVFCSIYIQLQNFAAWFKCKIGQTTVTMLYSPRKNMYISINLLLFYFVMIPGVKVFLSQTLEYTWETVI